MYSSLIFLYNSPPQVTGRPYRQGLFSLYLPDSALGKHTFSLVTKAFERRLLFVVEEPADGVGDDVLRYNGFEAKSESVGE